MKAVTWTMQGQRGQVSGGGTRMASGSLKAEHMASSREQVLANRLGYLLFTFFLWTLYVYYSVPPGDLRVLHLG